MGSIVTSSTPVLLQLGISAGTATANELALSMVSIARAEAAVKRFLRYDPVRRERTEFYPQLNTDQHPREGIWEVNQTHAYMRYRSSAATDEMQIRHLPIRGIAGLWVDYDGRFGKRTGAFATETLKVEGDDFWARYDGPDDAGELFCRDGILLSTGSWPTTIGTVKITYTGGYSDDEFMGVTSILEAVAIHETVVMEAARRAKQAFLFAKSNASAGSSGSGGWTAGTIQSEHLGDYSYQLGSSAGGSAGGKDDIMFGGIVDLLPESVERLMDYQNLGWVFVA